MASSRAGDPARDHLVWKRTSVEGRSALYGVAGEGPPVVFVHGWALGSHSYKRALKRLVGLGLKVFAPALPGFGGTGDLPGARVSFAGYGDWLDSFLTAVDVNEPVVLVGHSFGGGVSIQFAHDHPDRVRSLVLLNSVGGSAWLARGGKVRTLAERSLWDWGRGLPGEVLPIPRIARVLPAVMEDAVPNAVRNPRGLWRVANLVRGADLTLELQELKRRRLPVVVVWAEDDRIIPRASFDSLCTAIGARGEVVPGTHSWLMADPDAFGTVMMKALGAAKVARALEGEGAGPGGAGAADSDDVDAGGDVASTSPSP
jgi:pimeloyl-ACP methyl ester carboxylesterase